MIMQAIRLQEAPKPGKCPYKTMCEEGANFADTERLFGNCLTCDGFGYFFDEEKQKDSPCKDYGKIIQAREFVKRQLPLIKTRKIN